MSWKLQVKVLKAKTIKQEKNIKSKAFIMTRVTKSNSDKFSILKVSKKR